MEGSVTDLRDLAFVDTARQFGYNGLLSRTALHGDECHRASSNPDAPLLLLALEQFQEHPRPRTKTDNILALSERGVKSGWMSNQAHLNYAIAVNRCEVQKSTTQMSVSYHRCFYD